MWHNLSKFGGQLQLFMMNNIIYVWDFSQSEVEKYFEWIINNFISMINFELYRSSSTVIYIHINNA